MFSECGSPVTGTGRERRRWHAFLAKERGMLFFFRAENLRESALLFCFTSDTQCMLAGQLVVTTRGIRSELVGGWQVPVHPKDEKKIARCTHEGLKPSASRSQRTLGLVSTTCTASRLCEPAVVVHIIMYAIIAISYT